jgi:toxin ParE1/3/4
MKVRYRARALADLEDIFRYLSPRSLTGAEKVLRAIYAAIKEISEHPRSTLRTSDPDIRTKILGRYRYKIFYRIVDDDTVEIVHVRHGARRPWRIEE